MKILFVNASKRWNGRVYEEYPLGIGLLATIVEQAGHSVSIFDMAVDSRSIADIVLAEAPDVTALSFLSTSSQTATRVIRQLRQLESGHVVAGGIHTTLFPREVLDAGADVCVTGEGEPAILPLLEALSSIPPRGPYTAELLGHVPGVVFLDGEHRIRRSDAEAESVRLDSVPIVKRELFDLSRYRHHSLMTSRGCPYNCRFCCSWGPGGVRGRSVSVRRAVEEVESLARAFGALTFYWADEIFFFTRANRLALCRELSKRQLPVTWIGQLRADNIDNELADAMAEAGCTKLCLGAESGSDRVLKVADKRLTVQQVEAAIASASRAGMKVKTWWMVGLPGGNVDDQIACLDVIDRARPNEVAIHTFVPLPGTPFWDDSARYGIGLPSMDNLENLYYYGSPDDVRYDYITAEEMWRALETCSAGLETMGYVPTDAAAENSRYVYTSPLCRTTFAV